MNGHVELSRSSARFPVVVIASQGRSDGPGDYLLLVPKLIERAFDFGFGICLLFLASVYAPKI